ncbi:hypothetical protein [Halobacterium jilantaiense]|uniref:DUF8152 domain-containing protein n=1 Tax=Halobacterium jilantaiense TaxID=355548 RepID=A0A1I0QW03_9EURY|nr:hypothetical protein [Halobacterium jilantaiense]SEW31472.1 hypothetical protein SAMN04487945_3029 [Halobacterium jilantaiense]
MTDDDVRALHDHLAATGELPVERTASHYLGEAEAVVADALAPNASEDVVRRRVVQARDLLGEVEETGDDRADDHVDAARELCASILGGGD